MGSAFSRIIKSGFTHIRSARRRQKTSQSTNSCDDCERFHGRRDRKQPSCSECSARFVECTCSEKKEGVKMCQPLTGSSVLGGGAISPQDIFIGIGDDSIQFIEEPKQFVEEKENVYMDVNEQFLDDDDDEQAYPSPPFMVNENEPWNNIDPVELRRLQRIVYQHNKEWKYYQRFVKKTAGTGRYYRNNVVINPF